jgi:RimJ/RimL family protein N-acetyltransferase
VPVEEVAPADDIVRAPRLDLALLSPQVLAALAADDWATARALIPYRTPVELPDRLAGVARFRVEQIGEDPSTAPWLLRAIVLRDEQAMIGHAGLHGPPDERGYVEIGYTVWPDYRRRGFAEEAARALLGWAPGRPGVVGARASASPTNTPSLRLIAKLGLVEVGRQWDDEDGEEIVHEGPLPL